MWKNVLNSLIARFTSLTFTSKALDGFILGNKHYDKIDLRFGLNNQLTIESTILDSNQNLIQIKYQNGEVWQYRNIVVDFKSDITISVGKGLLKIIVGTEEPVVFNNSKIFFEIK